MNINVMLFKEHIWEDRFLWKIVLVNVIRRTTVQWNTEETNLLVSLTIWMLIVQIFALITQKPQSDPKTHYNEST